MNRTEISLVSIYDVQLSLPSRGGAVLDRIRSAAADTDLSMRYAHSNRWLLSLPPGFRRFTFPAEPGDTGSSILLDAKRGVGVYSVWRGYPADADLLEVKRAGWDAASKDVNRLQRYGLILNDVDRHFPFMAIRTINENIQALWTSESETLGRILTGGYAYERPSALRSAVEDEISVRTYERLALSWSDGLALYDDTVDLATYQLTLCRAVYLCEVCVLIRRMLRSTELQIDTLLPTITFWRPRPWSVRRVAQTLADIDREFVASPDVTSVEAESLLRAAYRRFGIDERLTAIHRSNASLERRFQWAKAQLLVALAVVTYMADKLKLFDLIRPAAD